uniref:Uncharacterized protein n=1 Tax=Anguilla anguilla TaxID=7936 RepID=A0A0E9WJP1_ANGAN
MYIYPERCMVGSKTRHYYYSFKQDYFTCMASVNIELRYCIMCKLILQTSPLGQGVCQVNTVYYLHVTDVSAAQRHKESAAILVVAFEWRFLFVF